MKKTKILYLLILLLTLGVTELYAASPAQILEKIAGRVNSAKSMEVSFSMTTHGSPVSGKLISKGSKFTLSSGGHSVWYDGRDMYAYNPGSREVTVWKPTSAELAESNPLLYITSYKDYTVKSGVTPSVIVLTPKRRGTGVKSVEITVTGAESSNPGIKQIKVAMSGGTTVVNVTSIRLNTNPSDAIFRFNKSKYPGVTITDLR